MSARVHAAMGVLPVSLELFISTRTTHAEVSFKQGNLIDGGMSGTSFIHGGNLAPILIKTGEEGPIM